MCTLCDAVRAVLPPLSRKVTRYCVYCGRPFEVYAGSRKMTCTSRCNTARWRAYTRLAASTPA